MMATVLLVMVSGGLLYSIIESYRIASLVRFRTEARAVLRSCADQFLNPTVEAHNLEGNAYTNSRLFFVSTNNATTGTGMNWDNTNKLFKFRSSADGAGNATGLIVQLGTAPARTINATLTRSVTQIEDNSDAGQLLLADFTIQFSIKTYPATTPMSERDLETLSLRAMRAFK